MQRCPAPFRIKMVEAVRETTRARCAYNGDCRPESDHMDYVADVLIDTNARANTLHGYAFEEEPPTLRHFLARFRPLC